MKYNVNVSAEAKRLIESQVHFIAIEKQEPQNAAIWSARVDDAISSLDQMPGRCAIAPESKHTPSTIRMLPVDSHLILFSVDDEGKTVNILSFRAGRESPKQSLGE